MVGVLRRLPAVRHPARPVAHRGRRPCEPGRSEHERRCKRQRQRQLADGAGRARTGDVRAQRPGTGGVRAQRPGTGGVRAQRPGGARADRSLRAGRADEPATAPATAPVPRPAPAPAQQSAPTAPLPRDVPQAQPQRPVTSSEVEVQRLKTAAARTAQNMESSLEVPTATSVRAIPAKLLIDNRIVVNNHLARARGGKVSFTHLVGFALVEALAEMPEMNQAYTEVEGKPGVARPAHINLGIAIDLAKDDGTRQLLVPNIKHCESMDFAQFWAAYEDVVRRARTNKLGADDFSGTTISLTNPGTIGTVHSVPRLMKGQGTIIGVGAMEYPAEYQGASEETLARLAVSKTMTLTSTYDHRIIQGAQSGDFLRIVHRKLLGEDGFYDRVFHALRLPYEPIRWVRDISVAHDDEINKTARVQELIHAYRVRGHLMADTDPLEYKQRRHPDLDVTTHGLTLWDLDREFPTGGFGGKPVMKLRHILGVLRDSYCRTIGIEYMHIQDPEQRTWIQDRVEHPYAKPGREEQLRILRRLNAAEAFETFLQTKFVGQKRFSLEGAESVIPLLDAVLSASARADLDEVCIGMPHRGRLNVLANIAGKSYGQIFREFEGTQDPKSVQGSGDVKYHLGTEGEFRAETGETTKVYLAANPSHLEAVNPVLEGVVRAKQDRLNRGSAFFSVLPVLLHGDAAFAGQGVVAETLNLSQLRGYRTGGTVHVVINNQVGLHHGAGLVAVVGLLHRRRPDDPGADLPRERRRPRGVRAGRAAGLRVPAGVRQGRRHRHGLLPAPRPQRGRRPLDDAAAHVHPDRGEALASASSTPRRSSAAATSPSKRPRARCATTRSSSSACSPRPRRRGARRSAQRRRHRRARPAASPAG